MDASQEIRIKLVLVIGNLISRCIEEARHIPYVLDQDQVVDILVDNPDFFAQLVREEQRDRTAFSGDRLTARIDALQELGQLEALDALDLTFSPDSGASHRLDPALDRIHQLTRTFVVYAGNMVTIFEKEFQRLMEKLRVIMQQEGLNLRSIDLEAEDLAGLETKATACLKEGRFLQAFFFDRLLNAEVITREFINLPSPDYSLNRVLLRRGLRIPSLRTPLVAFVLRACYVSQGNWQDLFACLVELAHKEPELFSVAELIEAIEKDGVFCCNLLCESFAALQSWSSEERRTAVAKRLET